MQTKMGRLSISIVRTAVLSLFIGLLPGIPLSLRAGSLVAWGSGNGTNVPAGLGDNLVAIAAGQEHGLALSADGLVTGWGTDSRHQATNLTGVVSDALAVAAVMFTVWR